MDWGEDLALTMHGRNLQGISWNEGLLAQAHRLCEAAHVCSRRGWVPATSGNFSLRDRLSGRILITGSGLDKGAISPTDLIEMDVDCHPIAGNGKPSAETSLHGVIYRAQPEARAIFHVHSIWNTLISDHFGEKGGFVLEGYELLKALSGVTTHSSRELIPILENSQEYNGLSSELESVLSHVPQVHCVLLRRHGIYTWGESVAGAWRHLEALEFLFEAECRRLMVPGTW